ncbi:Cob(III)alamin reductase @ Cob(II)alamin reductase [hydrothermal vent metagenome]|uniref:Cob(III)alamin reductase @ Cob(II)alamin reductase n=1 Tax=hydrothermal vent metagenome TaxID=652676 RepID=A0A3B1DCP8_9ZZZZ
MDLRQKIFNAGVVGAGGAGFPTHVKAGAKVEYMIANGAECEPLIHKDVELMTNYAEEIVSGMKLMMEQVSAKKGFFGIKKKNKTAIEKISEQIKNENIDLIFLEDYYPAGDEYELVYTATGRLIPPKGIPLNVGCVVNNVESLYNIYLASKEESLINKFVTVTGAVKEPKSFWAPIGTSFKELIDHASGTTISDYGMFVSGLMMGQMTFDTDEVVTKTTGGLIVLPKDHYLINRNSRTPDDMNRIGKSACDQCSYCTELCPRYLLGYDVQPHKVMRSLVFSKSDENYWNQYADLCCECGLCTLYACPEDLYPREACQQSKTEMRVQNFSFEQVKPVKVHPIKDGRKVPLKQLRKKLNVVQYEKPTPFTKDSPTPGTVKIMLKQHAGISAVATVDVGEMVSKGQQIGRINEGDLGANIHSSIEGVVKEVSSEFVIINN